MSGFQSNGIGAPLAVSLPSTGNNLANDPVTTNVDTPPELGATSDLTAYFMDRSLAEVVKFHMRRPDDPFAVSFRNIILERVAAITAGRYTVPTSAHAALSPEDRAIHEAANFIHSVLSTKHEHRKFQDINYCRQLVKDDTTGELLARLARKDEQSRAEQRIWLESQAKSLHSRFYAFRGNVEKKVKNFLAKYDLAIREVADGSRALPTWKPSPKLADPDIVQHLETLRIPCNPHEDTPNLLLHDLGDLKVNPDRIAAIFRPSDNSLFYNAPGSGKTRILLEGLCFYWGFYFTALHDESLSASLGSKDLYHVLKFAIPHAAGYTEFLPETNVPHFSQMLASNRSIARESFDHVILARLLIFKRFIEVVYELEQEKTTETSESDSETIGSDSETIGSDSETTESDSESLSDSETSDSDSKPSAKDFGNNDYRRRWLILQLFPSLVDRSRDIFVDLTRLLNKTSQKDCRIMMISTKKSLKKLGMLPRRLHCVLDEAQWAARESMDAFRSESKDNVKRPILRELIYSLQHQEVDLGVIVTGTSLSVSAVHDAVATAIQKRFNFKEIHDTGGFEGERNGHRDYLTRYLPASLINSASGEDLIERVCYWLRGRYRFTTSFMEELMCRGFHCPHLILNRFIESIAEIVPTDSKHFVDLDMAAWHTTQAMPITFRHVVVPFDRIQIATGIKDPDDETKMIPNPKMHELLGKVVYAQLLREGNPIIASAEATDLIEKGIARIIDRLQGRDSDGAQAVIDEVLILAKTMAYLRKRGRGLYHHIGNNLPKNDATGKENGFETYVAAFLAVEFATFRPLSDVFNFVSDTASNHEPPHWSTKRARLVMLHRGRDNVVRSSTVRYSFDDQTPSAPSLELGKSASTTQDYLDWMEFKTRAPFCFPSNKMGPDIICCLEFEDGTRIWLLIQTKIRTTTGNISLKDMLDAVRSVTPSHLYIDKNKKETQDLNAKTLQFFSKLPGRIPKSSGAGTYGVLRVVATHPGVAMLQRVWSPTESESAKKGKGKGKEKEKEKKETSEEDDMDVDEGEQKKESSAEQLKKKRIVAMDTCDAHPLASLNMDNVHTKTAMLEPRNILADMVKEARNAEERARVEKLKRKRDGEAAGNSDDNPSKKQKTGYPTAAGTIISPTSTNSIIMETPVAIPQRSMAGTSQRTQIIHDRHKPLRSTRPQMRSSSVLTDGESIIGSIAESVPDSETVASATEGGMDYDTEYSYASRSGVRHTTH